MEDSVFPTSITVRQSSFFVIIKLIMLDLLLVVFYAVFDMSILFIADTNPDLGLILQADWMGFSTLFIATAAEMVIIIFIVLNWVNEQFEIRNDEIIHRRGILRIREDVHSFRNFSSVTINQSLWGRIINYGTIKLYNPALNHTLFLSRIHNPHKIKNILTEKLPKINESVMLKTGK